LIANNNSNNNLGTSAFGAQDVDTNATAGISYRQYGNNHTNSNIDNITSGDKYYLSKHVHGL